MLTVLPDMLPGGIMVSQDVWRDVLAVLPVLPDMLPDGIIVLPDV